VRTALLAFVFVAALAGAASAEAYLRVIAQQAPVYSGPAATYRTIYDAHRDEVFEVIERGTRGYWFRVVLEDGTTGWIFGELVFPFEVGPEEPPGAFRRMGRAIKKAILGPSPQPYSDVEISFSAGMLDMEGMFLLRPAILIDSRWAVEAFGGLSPRAQKDVFLGGLGWTLRLAPGAAVAPFVAAGIGAAHIRPKADNFIDVEETLFGLAAGGGFEVTLKKQITVRTDYRRWILFDENKSNGGNEVTGGLAIFF
jgi:SH3 domain-containing protein